ncbi:MAG: hypothetical protein IAG13_38165 [Deltaproteobacteria bacterium]|nr:hypothetical protein [Nannocystaceae bacterium]
MIPARTLVILATLALGCPSVPERSGTGASSREPSMVVSPTPSDTPKPEAVESIVFADRTSQGYLLLVPTTTTAAPTRDELAALVEREMAAETDQPEVALLLQLVAAEPTSDPRAAKRGLPRDLIGLHIELLDAQRRGEVLPDDALVDPVLTRELGDTERKQLGTHRFAILLRADYRNEHGVRGLRLLQTLVRLVAKDRGALVHDPDTRETMGVEAFTRRRLQGGFGNLAEQVAVVPFPDRLHGDPWVRLTTRGMRRFGAPDLELGGLPRDPALLQQATFMLHGLALQMAQAAEIDPSGLPVELDADLDVRHGDIARAYGNAGTVPRCSDCVGEITLRLVPRAAEANDPQGHVVARVTPPRDEGEKAPTDHPAWVRGMLARLLGPS